MTVQLKVIFKESLQHCVSAKVRTTPCFFFAKAELLFAKTREGCLAACEIAPFGKRSQEAILPFLKRDRTAEVMRIGHNPFFWSWGL